VDDDLFVSADPVQIEQILLNLILNALHSIASAGHNEPVLLSARKCGDRVVIEVLDRGIGVDPKIEKDLFSYFVSTKDGGLGIGLNLSATLALSFGGKIEHRRPINGGARFLLDLPYAEES
jgi:C4-dicarboxylate-specific signal transduction histidine kinase